MLCDFGRPARSKMSAGPRAKTRSSYVAKSRYCILESMHSMSASPVSSLVFGLVGSSLAAPLHLPEGDMPQALLRLSGSWNPSVTDQSISQPPAPPAAGCTTEAAAPHFATSAPSLPLARPVAHGWDHSLLADASGRVYARGCNRLGQTDPTSYDEVQAASEPPYLPAWRLMRPLAGVEVTQVAAGEFHSLALAADGSVWSWGGNSDGQLGIGACSPHSGPACILGPASAAQRSADVSTHSTRTVPSAESDVGGREGSSAAYQQAWASEPCCHVAAGGRHSAVTARSGRLWTCGWNAYGQLGTGETCTAVATPTPVAALGGLVVVQAAAGLGHTLALTDCGDVYAFGWNADGQLGIGSDVASPLPVLVECGALESEGVAAVSAGARHSAVLGAAGSLFTWGLNNCGQLGPLEEAGGNCRQEGVGGCAKSKNEPARVQLTDSSGQRCKALGVQCGRWHTVVVVQEACNDP